MTKKKEQKERNDAPMNGYVRWSVHIKEENLQYLKEESALYKMTLKNILEEIIEEDIRRGKSNSERQRRVRSAFYTISEGTTEQR